MLSESDLRRAGFTFGMSIPLADGQRWMFPILAEGSRLASSDDSAHAELLDAVRESENLGEQLLAELALCIDLLERNYHLSAQQLRSLFEFEPNDPAQSETQRAFHELAVRALRVQPVRQAGGFETRLSGTWPRAGLLAPLAAKFLGRRAPGAGRAGALGGETRS